MTFISTLKLHNFRCYRDVALTPVSAGLVVLYGPNGAGKTNLLEALSLLSPGRGLRGARNMEIQCQSLGQNASKPWAVAATLETSYGAVQLGTGLDGVSEKRIVRINGVSVRGQNALAEHMGCVWLTPQMDRLFLDSTSHRRRFLDRLIFAFDPGHSGRVTRYENAMRQRSKLLSEGKNEPSWLDSLEAQMAETALSIVAARLDFVERLQGACEAADHSVFPLAQLRAQGTLEEILAKSSALEVEDVFKYQLSQSRQRDAVVGGASSGPHKSDLRVRYAAKNMPADQCSTGEQKALLIGIIMAHAQLIAAERGAPPILLLDEVAAHLDEVRRAALYEMLIALGGQVWLTGTDKNLFTAIEGSAQFYEVRDASVG